MDDELTISSDITEQQSISTHEILLSLGFVEAQSSPYLSGGLLLDCGNFKLYAHEYISRRCAFVVAIMGIISTPREITDVYCEIPREVESWEQGVAWVTWCFDHQRIETAIPFAWLEIGRQNRNLLPWERRLAAYNARPYCYAQREWVRVALKTLSSYLMSMDDDAPVIFQFDGEVLSIRCDSKLIAFPATGERWPCQYQINASQLSRLPKRLMRESIGFSVWESALIIGRIHYSGVVAINGSNG